MASREVEYLNYLQRVSKAVNRSNWIADMRGRDLNPELANNT
jgi:hypothetical protein